MHPFSNLQDPSTWLVFFLVCFAILLVLAVVNYAVARLAERRHPPTGSFVEVDGVRLHYSDRGTGRPVVLLHGNAVTGADYNTSGMADRLIGTYRVVIFDRPGFGYSERPRGRIWTARAQADLIHAALVQLAVSRPVIVGHSWGTLVALELAVRYPVDTAGLVLLSGYYFPTPRVDVLPVAVLAIPLLGDILSHTVSPLFGWLMMPGMKRAMFAPSPMTPSFKREYSSAMELRPSQLRASAVDGTLMVPGAMSVSAHYGELVMPVAIMAGDGDLVVSDSQAERLHTAVRGSDLRIIVGVGHMIHHVATQQVVEAIAEVAARSSGPSTGHLPEAG